MKSNRGPGLDHARILAAAVQLADTHGIAKLTMRRLAAELGVEAMSLYHHFRNKDAILGGLVEAVFEEIELPGRDLPWEQALAARTRSAREVLLRHRWALGLLDSRASPGAANLRHHDALLGCLRRARFTLSQCAHALSLLDAYLYGSVLQEISLPYQSHEEMVDLGEAMKADLPAEELPYLAEMMTEYSAREDYDYADEFDVGMALVLDSLRRLRSGEVTLAT